MGGRLDVLQKLKGKPMTLQQLQYFLAAIDGGSFTAAGEQLHLSQPSVSEQVRRLEDELGVQLFQRVGRGLVVTEAGLALRPRAEAVLGAVDAARESVVAVRELRGGTVSFGTLSTARDYLGSDMVSKFRKQYPGVRVRIVGLNSSEAADGVREGKLEAAIVGLPVDDHGLEVRPVIEDELLFASTDPEKLREPMTIERLAQMPLVMPDASFGIEDPTRRNIAELAQRAGVTIEPVVDVETVGSVFDLVAAGVGDTIMEAGLLNAAERRVSRKIGWVPFADPIRLTLAFVFRRGAPLSPAAREMVAIVEQRLRETADVLERAPRQRLPG